MLTIFVSKPPSVNIAYANITGKGRVKTNVYKVWSLENLYRLKPQLNNFVTIEKPFYTIFVLPKLRSNADGDNLIKPLFDLIQDAKIVKNDSLQDGHTVHHGNENFIIIHITGDYFKFCIYDENLKNRKKEEIIKNS